MKNLSRNYVYWPTLDQDLEKVCKSCESCNIVRDSPPHSSLHPWEFPLHPWQRLHADFAEYSGKRYLIVVDAHSKWIEVLPMNRTNAETTISALMTLFSRFGLPAQLVTDNGPPFSSFDFKKYCTNNCIRHVFTAPYRPQGNGAAENAVKTVKKVIKRAIHSGENVHQALSEFLFSYRNCEHATTGVPPSVLLLGRRLRNRLDALRPDVAEVVRSAQQRQIVNAGGTSRAVEVGEPVLARDYSARGGKWLEGTIAKRTGPVSFKVRMNNGDNWRRHQDQIVPLTIKARHSLSRTSIGKSKCNSDQCCEEEENFEDASGGMDISEGEKDIEKDKGVEATCPPSVCSPPPNASARALRAFNLAYKS